LYAEVRPHPNKLILHTTLSDGTRKGPFELPMDPDALLAEAQTGGFFSYAAGVAYQVMTHYRVRGLAIDNYATDLPIQKGLSSSAAICVLVARAFNRTYDLKMTIRGEMEFAYMGEITTPSRCGRMDQGCAFGNRPILMTFDGERIDVKELALSGDLYFIIVDLNAAKDTKEILSKLNQSYPFTANTIQQDVQKYLGPINKRLVSDAVNRLQSGDADRLGLLMNEAQAEFDRHLQPACPSQLTAPVLHKLLTYKPIQPYILGGKGVGSQGDGSAQLLVKDARSQEKVMDIIQKNLGMPCLKLVLQTGRRIRKAVIPAAGFGTRLFPASKSIKKELFPVIDSRGRAKPVIMAIVEEAVHAGIEEVCIVVQEADRPTFEEFFHTPPRIENFNKLSKEDQAYSQYLLDLGHRVTFAIQETQEGFGHSVYCAREWVGDESFLLMLGDHIYASDHEISCVSQCLELYEQVGQNIVGLKVTPIDELKKFGTVSGTWEKNQSILSVAEFSEKPEPDYARDHLHIEGMDVDQFLTVFGLYILSSTIFDYLEEHITHNVRERGEFQLTSCLDRLRKDQGFKGLVVKGRRFDIGNPAAYRQTLLDFRNG
jgi:UTP-glucose-1-phosphate uridylyltransferase/mevalonate kinase